MNARLGAAPRGSRWRRRGTGRRSGDRRRRCPHGEHDARAGRHQAGRVLTDPLPLRRRRRRRLLERRVGPATVQARARGSCGASARVERSRAAPPPSGCVLQLWAPMHVPVSWPAWMDVRRRAEGALGAVRPRIPSSWSSRDGEAWRAAIPGGARSPSQGAALSAQSNRIAIANPQRPWGRVSPREASRDDNSPSLLTKES